MSAIVIPLPPVAVPARHVPDSTQAWASRYAAAGLPPIAITPNEKRPLHKGWQHVSIGDTLHHLAATPAANLGIAVPQGLMVLDVDIKGDGPSTLMAFEIQNGPLPETLRARTPSGGMHYWFAVPNGAAVPNSVAFAMGLDVRSAGKGLVVAAPSTVNGKTYEWENWGTSPALAPDWLLSAIRVAAAAMTVPVPQDREPLSIPAGQRNATLFKAASAMRAQGFSDDVISSAVSEMNRCACAEPLGNAEIAIIVGSAGKYERDVQPWEMGFGADGAMSPGATPEPSEFGAIVPLDAGGGAFEPLPHLVAKWIPQDEVTLLAGHGGGGKSYLALSIAVHVALGRPIGQLVTVQAITLFYSAEDGARVLQARLARICRSLEISPTQLEGKLILLDASDIDPALFQRTALPALDRLAALTVKHDARLVVIDNASDAFDGDEIKRAEVRGFIRALRGRLARPGRSVLLLAHINKSSVGPRTSGSEDYSGSTAWHNSVRSRLSLNPSGPDHMTIDHMKANHGPKAELVRVEWRDGVPMVVAATPFDWEADAVRKVSLKTQLLDVIRKMTDRGDRVPTSRTGAHSTFKAMSASTGFPSGLDKDTFVRLIYELQDEGEICRRSIKVDYKDREVFLCAH